MFEFTIHFATINTKNIHKSSYIDVNLQYTLLLLIRYIHIDINNKKNIYNTLCYY